jgi:hypothetical protein
MQIFHRSLNTISKVTMFGAVFILAGLGWAWARYVRSDYVTRVEEHVEQPVPFSHQHHVAGLGIDCRYCHTGVEKSGFAGLPPTHTCMNCHQQIWARSPVLAPVRDSHRSGKSLPWNRVHNLAEFVYFNHSIHVAKGVGCSTCHGRVDQMSLTRQTATLHMEWCLDCHRAPEKHLRPLDKIYDMEWQPPPDQVERGRELMRLHNVSSKTDCSTCHR